jgi:hypothetical protein
MSGICYGQFAPRQTLESGIEAVEVEKAKIMVLSAKKPRLSFSGATQF